MMKKRLFSLLLAVVMLFALLPLVALAEEGSEEPKQDPVASEGQGDNSSGEGATEEDPAEKKDPDEGDASDPKTDPADPVAQAAEPVQVVFACTPEDLTLTVYAKPEAEEAPVLVQPEADGSYLLLPGDYLYTAAAQGYVSAEEVPFTVAASAEPLQISVTLTALPADVPEEAPAEPAKDPEEPAAEGTETEPAQPEEESLQTRDPLVKAPLSIPNSGQCGDNVFWILKDEVLTIYGSGAMWDFFQHSDPPDWNDWIREAEDITEDTPKNQTKSTLRFKKVVIQDGITHIGMCSFLYCDYVQEVSIPATVTSVGMDAFYGCPNLISAGPAGGDYSIVYEWKTSIPAGAFFGADVQMVILPEGITHIGECAFEECNSLTIVCLPKSLKQVGMYAFSNCYSLSDVYYIGSVTEANLIEWGLHNQEIFDATWHYNNPGPNIDAYSVIYFITEGDPLNEMVEVDGVPYLVVDGMIILPPGVKASVITQYTYNLQSDDPHKVYPVGMKVWIVETVHDITIAKRIPEFDDILQYAGSSIRYTGNKGIRMITGISKDKRTKLIKNQLAGYTLVEYGTVVGWDSELDGGALVLNGKAARQAYAYKKGVADPIFQTKNGVVQYTNVLVGLTDEKCKPDLSMRPYMIVRNAAKNEFIIYGGTVHRSIGYIAYQNRDAFRHGTKEYKFIWDIIHFVYGNQYDSEYWK